LLEAVQAVATVCCAPEQVAHAAQGATPDAAQVLPATQGVATQVPLVRV